MSVSTIASRRILGVRALGVRSVPALSGVMVAVVVAAGSIATLSQAAGIAQRAFPPTRKIA